MQTPGAPGHSASAWQARQVLVAVLQTGFVFDVQSALVTHSTQAPLAAQAGVAALAAAHSPALAQARQLFVPVAQIGFVACLQSLPATHSTHAPVDAHAGVPASAPAHSVPVAQPRHFFDVASQTGVLPLHEAAVQGGATSVGTSIVPSAGASVRSTGASMASLTPPSWGTHKFLASQTNPVAQAMPPGPQ